MRALDQIFDKWYKSESVITGALNAKSTKIKNQEFRQRMEAWRRRADQRTRQKKRLFERGKQLRKVLSQYEDFFDIEIEKVHDCLIHFNDMAEEITKQIKEEKVANDALAQLPDTHQIECRMLEQIQIAAKTEFDTKMAVMARLVDQVKRDCII